MSRFVSLVVILALVAIAPVALAAEDGKALFDSKCAMCHGKDGVAKAMAKNSRNFNDAEYQKAATVEEISKIIEDGKGKMPPNKGKLSAEQIQAIAAHVKTLAPAAK